VSPNISQYCLQISTKTSKDLQIFSKYFQISPIILQILSPNIISKYSLQIPPNIIYKYLPIFSPNIISTYSLPISPNILRTSQKTSTDLQIFSNISKCLSNISKYFSNISQILSPTSHITKY